MFYFFSGTCSLTRLNMNCFVCLVLSNWVLLFICVCINFLKTSKRWRSIEPPRWPRCKLFVCSRKAPGTLLVLLFALSLWIFASTGACLFAHVGADWMWVWSFKVWPQVHLRPLRGIDFSYMRVVLYTCLHTVNAGVSNLHLFNTWTVTDSKSKCRSNRTE